MFNVRSIILVSCLLLAGCNGCTDSTTSSQDATVDAADVVVDASSDVVSVDRSDVTTSPCRDAGMDVAEVALVPGC